MTVWTWIVDQDDVVEQIRRASDSARIIIEYQTKQRVEKVFTQDREEDAPDIVREAQAFNHAWLLVGPPGSGRSVAARALAAALQCEAGGCGECKECRLVKEDKHPDVNVLATDKSTITINEVRNLVFDAQMSPSNGKWRVMIVEDMDRMLEQSTNVLLKSVEEPPARTIWILCAPALTDVLPTIRSRCRLISLRMPRPQAVAEMISETIHVDQQLALECTLQAQSHIGIAKHLIIDEHARQDREQTIIRVADLISVTDAVVLANEVWERGQKEIEQKCQTINAQERIAFIENAGVDSEKSLPAGFAGALKTIEAEQKKREKRLKADYTDRVISDIASIYRDALVIGVGGEGVIFNLSLRRQVDILASRYTPASLINKMEYVQRGRKRLQQQEDPLLVLEDIIISLTQAIK